MFVGDIYEESKASIEDDSPNIFNNNIIHSELIHIYI